MAPSLPSKNEASPPGSTFGSPPELPTGPAPPRTSGFHAGTHWRAHHIRSAGNGSGAAAAEAFLGNGDGTFGAPLPVFATVMIVLYVSRALNVCSLPRYWWLPVLRRSMRLAMGVRSSTGQIGMSSIAFSCSSYAPNFVMPSLMFVVARCWSNSTLGSGITWRRSGASGGGSGSGRGLMVRWSGARRQGVPDGGLTKAQGEGVRRTAQSHAPGLRRASPVRSRLGSADCAAAPAGVPTRCGDAPAPMKPAFAAATRAARSARALPPLSRRTAGRRRRRARRSPNCAKPSPKHFAAPVWLPSRLGSGAKRRRRPTTVASAGGGVWPARRAISAARQTYAA